MLLSSYENIQRLCYYANYQADYVVYSDYAFACKFQLISSFDASETLALRDVLLKHCDFSHKLIKISDDLFQLLHLVMYLFKPSLLVLVKYFPLMEVKTWQKSVLKLKLFLNVIAAAYSKSGCLWNVSLLNSC